MMSEVNVEPKFLLGGELLPASEAQRQWLDSEAEYGTTSGCGSSYYGTVWEVSKTGKETILHNFAGPTLDGSEPMAGVTRDPKGNLYGVSSAGGAYYSHGALCKLNTKGKLTLLHSFDGSDGVAPYGEVLRTVKGTLFGTTVNGGYQYGCLRSGCGTLWEYVP